MGQIEDIDISGNLETISNLARIGMLLIELGKHELIPTVLEDVYEHSQRLVDEYAVVKEKETVQS